MSNQTRILEALRKSEALCDDCLSDATVITPRQSINASCREMQGNKILQRAGETCLRCGRVKIVNRLNPLAQIQAPDVTPRIPSEEHRTDPYERPWYWEGSVQEQIVRFMKSEGCAIESTSDTSTRQQGKDIVASDQNGRTIWVTVKGFPEKSKNIQARHWFAGALLDLARYRDESEHALLAMGLPSGFSTYEALLGRTRAVREFLRYAVYWVKSDGTVTRDDLRSDARRSSGSG